MLGFAIETSNVSGASAVASEYIITVASAESAFESNCTRVVVGGLKSDPDVALTARVANSEKLEYRI